MYDHLFVWLISQDANEKKERRKEEHIKLKIEEIKKKQN
jgi:hypothetical protein